MRISDNALRLWMAHFMNPSSTLAFGGENAELQITPEARSALNELLALGAAKPIAPTDSWPGREYYGAGGLDLLAEFQKRPHLNPFKDPVGLATFVKEAPLDDEG